LITLVLAQTLLSCFNTEAHVFPLVSVIQEHMFTLMYWLLSFICKNYLEEMEAEGQGFTNGTIMAIWYIPVVVHILQISIDLFKVATRDTDFDKPSRCCNMFSIDLF
ncbi:hypothetical protein ACJX0J_027833, partial [Zea mays]